MSRPGGFLFNFIPIVPLAKDDPRILSQEEHPIETAGIGYFLEDFTQDFVKAKSTNQVKVVSLEATEVDGEEAQRLEVLFDEPGKDYPRVSVAFSKKHNLPVEIRLYAEPDGDPEVYRYLNLKLNPPRDDEAFQKSIDRRLYDHYQKIE